MPLALRINHRFPRGRGGQAGVRARGAQGPGTRIDGDFTTIGALQLKVRAQARRIEDLESGAAYAAEVARRKALQRDYESQVGSLRREVADLGRLNDKMIRGWWETCEYVRREGEEAAAGAMRAARAQEGRALRAERRRDELAAQVTALNGRVRELEDKQ